MNRDRFFGKTVPEPNTGCLLWLGSTKDGGYGNIKTGGRWVGAHRIAWILEHGPIPDSLHVCHKCDMPLCVEVRHLFLGTAGDNARDKARKGRAPAGDAHSSSVLTSAMVERARELASSGMSQSKIGKQMGVTQSAISRALSGNTWKNLRKKED